MKQPLQRLRSIIPTRCLGPASKCAPLQPRSFSTSCGARRPCRRNILPVKCKLFSRGYAKEVPSPRTPGISQTEYDLRRTVLAASLPESSVCVLVGASMKYSSDSVLYSTLGAGTHFSYPFHQDPNFFYLTGFVEKNALAVIRIASYCSIKYQGKIRQRLRDIHTIYSFFQVIPRKRNGMDHQLEPKVPSNPI